MLALEVGGYVNSNLVLGTLEGTHADKRQHITSDWCLPCFPNYPQHTHALVTTSKMSNFEASDYNEPACQALDGNADAEEELSLDRPRLAAGDETEGLLPASHGTQLAQVGASSTYSGVALQVPKWSIFNF